MHNSACAVSAVPGKRRASARAPVLRDAERASEEEGRWLPARPKGLIVIVGEDAKDPRASSSVVSESELKHWEYHEPTYSEKLAIGFAMLASEQARL
jgi:hypothetical protein